MHTVHPALYQKKSLFESIQKLCRPNNISGFFLLEFVCALALCVTLAAAIVTWQTARIAYKTKISRNLAALETLHKTVSTLHDTRRDLSNSDWIITTKTSPAFDSTKHFFLITIAHKATPHETIITTLGY